MTNMTRYARACNSGVSVMGVTNPFLVRFKVHTGDHPPPYSWVCRGHNQAGVPGWQEDIYGPVQHLEAGGPHYDKQLCDGEMGDKEKQNGPCVVERRRKK